MLYRFGIGEASTDYIMENEGIQHVCRSFWVNSADFKLIREGFVRQ